MKLRAIRLQHELEWQYTFICTGTKKCQWKKLYSQVMSVISVMQKKISEFT